MKHALTLPPALQLLSIGAMKDVTPSSTNEQSTPVEAVVVAGQ